MLCCAGLYCASSAEEAATAASAGAGPIVAGVIDNSEIERVDECLDAMVCIDRYLWTLYVRTQKIDTVKVPEQVNVTVKSKGRTRVVTRTIEKWVTENFSWKDPDAAQKVGMSAQDYVIGGMEPAFRVKLFHALRALDDAGLMPGITSAFRDDYRQAIATGQKAQNDRSYHGGSFRGGYGHGQAADIVSIKGETRADRIASSDTLWHWVDSHEKELGIGRPYLDRDAPHVAALDGPEFFSKRIEPKMRQADRREAAKAHRADKVADNAHVADKKRADDKKPADDKKQIAEKKHVAQNKHVAEKKPTAHRAASKPRSHQRFALHNERSAPRRAKAVRHAGRARPA
jgi:hypothetical protein